MGVYQWVRQTIANLTSPRAVSGAYKGQDNPGGVFANVDERPPFSLVTIEQMGIDPKVCIALGVRNGLLMQAEVEVEGGPPRIREWVENEWKKLWLAFAARILETKNFGFQGFELMLTKDRDQFPGKLTFESYRDFHPRDILPLVINGRVVGCTVNNVTVTDDEGKVIQKQTKVPIFNPKGIWLTYNSRYGTFFGRSLLRGAYLPWYEKTMRGGAIKLRQLRMLKDAWVGDIIRYPSKQKTILPNGQEVSYKDVAREWVENRMSGGIGGLPSDVDPTSKTPLWDYTPPRSIDGASQIFDYKDSLDDEILDALETPAEVIQAVKDGGLGGPGGRSIPFVALCAILQDEFAEYLSQLDYQYLRNGVRLNFNVEPVYRIRAKSLIQTLSALMGGQQAPQQGFAGAGPVSGSVPTALRSQNFSGSINGQGATGAQSLQLSENSPRVIQRIEPRKAGKLGAVVGGVYYRPGEWIDGLALQFASGREVLGLSDFAEPEAILPPVVVPAKFSNTQIEITGELAGDIRRLAEKIPDDDLAEDGREYNPHITVKYGLHADSAEDARPIITAAAPVAIQIGPASVFSADEYDVVKLEVISDSLRALNSKIADAMPHTDTYPEYSPHITIAYVRKGLGEFWAARLNELAGKTAVFERVHFSDKLRNKTGIPLTGKMEGTDNGELSS